MIDTLRLHPHWLWLILACLFLAVEVLVMPTGLLLCMGSSAAVVAAVTFLLPDMGWVWAVFLFSVCLVASGVVWRRVAQKKRSGEDHSAQTLNARDRQLIGYRAVLAEPIVGGKGRLRVHDSAWPVEADEDYPAGVMVEVEDVRGIILKIRAVDYAN